jgi:ribonucleoside-diphosphate reductase alpha chain
VVIRADDDFMSLKRKVRLATILGTFQASLTNFGFMGETWKKNTEEEALLGVSLTGIMDNPLTSGQESKDMLIQTLESLRDYTVEINKEWADKVGIKYAAAITTCKPSGTVSQLVNCASGIHARYSKYYLRTVRTDKKDPLYQFMVAKGIYCEDDVMKPETGAVFYFPIKAPDNCITTTDRTAVEQLETWLLYQRHWTHHKPSVTINVEDNEWMEVGAWTWKHFDEVSGVSFLPGGSSHSYRQAPYQSITEQEYNDWVEKHPMPSIDWSQLSEFEKEDTTTGTQTLSCSAGICELA